MGRDAKGRFVAELEDQVTPGAKRAASSLKSLQDKLKKFNNSGMGKAVAKMQQWGKEAIVVGAVATAAVGAAVAGLTVKTIDFAQRSRQAFSLLAKGGEKPEELFQRSIALAQELGLDVMDTTKQIQKFRALQFSQDAAEDLIKQGADMQALGTSVDEVSRIYAQLGQIQAKGKLQGEELIVLAENGLSTQLVYEALEKQMGKTRAEILKLQASGGIDSKNALEAIGTAILHKTGTTEFGQAGKMAATATMSGLLSVFKSRVQGAFIQLADAVGPSVMGAFKSILEQFSDFGSEIGLFDRLAGIFKLVARAVERAAPLVRAFFEGFSGGVLTGVSGALMNVSEALANMSKADMFAFGEQLGTMLGQVIEQLSKLATAVDIISSPIGRMAVWLGAVVAIGWKVIEWAIAIGTALGKLGAVWLFLQNTLGIVITLFSTVVLAIGAIPVAIIAAVALIGGALIYKFWGPISEFFSALPAKALEWGTAIVMGIYNGIKAAAMYPINALNEMAGGMVGAIKSTLQIHSPSKVFEGIGENVSQGMVNGLANMPALPYVNSPSLGSDTGGGIAAGGAAAARSSGGGGNSITFAPVFQFTASPGASKADGQAMAEGAIPTLRRAFNSLLEDAGLEGGLVGAT